MWNMIAILFLGTTSAYLLYWGRAWFKSAHASEQKAMMVGQRFAEQTALTAALTVRTRAAIDELALAGFSDAAVLFEDIIADDLKLRAEYTKQYELLRDEVNRHARS